MIKIQEVSAPGCSHCGEARKTLQKEIKSQFPEVEIEFIDEKLDLSYVELSKIYRQKDEDFIKILNAVHNRSITDEHLALLNSRLKVNFEPGFGKLFVSLTPTNDLADSINQRQLDRLPGRILTYQGIIYGDFDKKALPTDIELKLKVDAQVMLVNNDRQGRWINGTVGKIVNIDHDKETNLDVIIVEFTDGEKAEVIPHTWEMFRFFLTAKLTGLIRR